MSKKITSGIEGLDHIMMGGFIENRSYLLSGGPGTGKSILSYHFLQSGIQKGEETLLVSFSETEENVRKNAGKLQIDLSELNVLDLTPQNYNTQDDMQSYTVFEPGQVENYNLLGNIVKAFEKVSPTRVVIDSITVLRMLSDHQFHLRKMALKLIKHMCGQGATLLLTAEIWGEKAEDEISHWVDGVLNINVHESWRKIEIKKYRGTNFFAGIHTAKISDTGMAVYPRLKPSRYERKFANEILSSGIDELDSMLSGGIEKGTCTLVTGPSGVGKTNLSIQFAKAAAERNERTIIYSFEESEELIIRRSEGINVPIKKMIGEKNLEIHSVEPLSTTADEFSEIVRTQVETQNTSLILLDTISSYKLAIREDDALERLHSLSVYLQNMGVTFIIMNETNNITGEFRTTDLNASYLSDNIIYLRYMEAGGKLDKAIGILKKRLSGFDNNIRQFQITNQGIRIGSPYKNLKGILSGMPDYFEKE